MPMSNAAQLKVMRLGTPVLFVFLTALFAFFVFSALPLILPMIGTASIKYELDKGPAPEGDFNMRRTWGIENLPHFERVDKWVRTVDRIIGDIGAIDGVAPIGEPNLSVGYHGEYWSEMNLQVIGERGEGTLRLKGVCTNGPVDNKRLSGVEIYHWTPENKYAPSTGRRFAEPR